MWKNVLSNVCLGFFGADAILAHTKAWDLVTKMPRAFHDPSIQFNFHHAWERTTSLKFLNCAFTLTQTFEADVLQLFLQSLFIILSFLLESSSVKMSQVFHHTSMYFKLLQSPSRVGKVNKLKTPEMGLYFDSVVWGGYLTMIFMGSFHYLKFLAKLNFNRDESSQP